MTSASVIIPVFNTAPFLRKSLDSLLAQTHEDFQAICIDDGSTDDSLEILREYESKDSRISVVTKKNTGVADTRNLGLSLARGEYVYFLDADDWLDPALLSENISIANKQKCDVVMFGFREVTAESRVIATHAPFVSQNYQSRDQVSASLSAILRENRINPVWNKLYRRSSIMKSRVVFPSQRVGEDALFNYKAFSSFSSVSTNANVYYNYVVARPMSATSSKLLEIFDDNRELIPCMRQLFSSFHADDDGVINESIVNLTFLGHIHAAKVAVQGDGYSQFMKTIRRQNVGGLLALMDEHGLVRMKHKVKRLALRFPSLIYIYMRSRSPSSSP